MSIFSWESHDLRFLRLQWNSIVISKFLNHDFLMKIWTKSTFLRKHTPPHVAILHLLVYCGPTLIYYSGQKLDFKIFIIFPIIKSMFSHYNLKRGGHARKMDGKFKFLHIWVSYMYIQSGLLGFLDTRNVLQIYRPYSTVLIHDNT